MTPDKNPPQPEWMKKYMKSGKDLERQLQDTVIDHAPQWTPGDAAEFSVGPYHQD
jgi:hypothetical protein